MVKIKEQSGFVGEGVKFERTRRITGYLSSTSRFNNAKLAELQQRRVHGGLQGVCHNKYA